MAENTLVTNNCVTGDFIFSTGGRGGIFGVLVAVCHLFSFPHVCGPATAPGDVGATVPGPPRVYLCVVTRLCGQFAQHARTQHVHMSSFCCSSRKHGGPSVRPSAPHHGHSLHSKLQSGPWLICSNHWLSALWRREFPARAASWLTLRFCRFMHLVSVARTAEGFRGQKTVLSGGQHCTTHRSRAHEQRRAQHRLPTPRTSLFLSPSPPS